MTTTAEQKTIDFGQKYNLGSVALIDLLKVLLTHERDICGAAIDKVQSMPCERSSTNLDEVVKSAHVIELIHNLTVGDKV